MNIVKQFSTFFKQSENKFMNTYILFFGLYNNELYKNNTFDYDYGVLHFNLFVFTAPKEIF